MTASSVGLFPCRVQPIGLPPTAASNAPFNNSGNISSSSSSSSSNNNNNNNNHISRHHPIRHIRIPPTSTEVRRVSRNLFGKAERTEIEQVMRAEYERNCTYMRERYCFDIRNPPSADKNEKKSSSLLSSSTQRDEHAPLPTLIAQEVELQACKRQRKCNNSSEEEEKSELISEKITFTTQEQNYASLKTPTSAVTKSPFSPASLQNDRNSESSAAAIEKETTTTTSSSDEKLSATSEKQNTIPAASSQKQSTQQKQQLILCNAATSNERHKINAKQTLITDCFNVRKSSTTSTLQQHTKGGNLDEVLSQQRTNANVLLKVQIFKTSTAAQT